MEQIFAAAEAGGPWALVALAVATLLSEDLACLAAGLLVARGALGFGEATAACFTGIFVGDLLLVGLGRWLGRVALDRWPLRGRVSAAALARAEDWFARSGARVVLASRFMPGTRLPTFVAAGVLRAPLGKFIGWFALACALWTPLLVGAAWAAGEAVFGWFSAWSRAVPVLLLAAGAGWVALRLGGALATWRGRRLVWSRWQRLTRWEFWPMWAVYPPVITYIAWLGLRHRGMMLFTAVNPGMGAGGGLVGESKSEILSALAGAGERIAAWAAVPAGGGPERAAAVAAFQGREGAARRWPVVLKPDIGERGSGVVIARSEAEIAAKLAADGGALIVQRYVPGVEFGVFYTRRPSEPCGRIFAVTDKRTVAVAGDGRSTLEQLILADERAVCMAAYFLSHYGGRGRLGEVPAAGAEVVLAELGTHCRGALFLDGAHLITPALEAAVEAVSRAHAGFYFGRYDVRTASAEALQRGEFTVIELNGVSSEATSIYDPRHSLWHGWRTLCAQWREAYAIAVENRARGARVLTTREVMALVAR
jgi:membrane protein DedA with SNARE-associated domain